MVNVNRNPACPGPWLNIGLLNRNFGRMTSQLFAASLPLFGGLILLIFRLTLI
jgi:hypothetical protein